MNGNGLSSAEVIRASITDCVSRKPARTYRIPVWGVWCDKPGYRDVPEDANTVILRGWSCEDCSNERNT